MIIVLKRIFIFLLVSSLAFGANFVNPSSFKGTQKEKEAVVAWIKQNIKEEYSAVGMDDPMTLRMMENEDLNAFKALTQVTDKDLLKNVMKQYRAAGMDTYNVLLMMYKEQKKASNSSLNW
jgi:hypothetical protein